MKQLGKNQYGKRMENTRKLTKNMLPKYTKTMRKHDENFPKTGKNMSPKTEEKSVKTLRKQAENKLRKQDNDTCLQVHAR